MTEHERVIHEAARLLLDPGEGVVTIQMRVDGDNTTATYRTGKNADPEAALKTAISALEAELTGLQNCPAHKAGRTA